MLDIERNPYSAIFQNNCLSETLQINKARVIVEKKMFIPSWLDRESLDINHIKLIEDTPFADLGRLAVREIK